MHFGLERIPSLSRSGVGRAEELRSDHDALRAGWAGALLLYVDRTGRFRATAEGALDFAEPSSAEPEPGAVFMGTRDGRHVWAARRPALSGDLADLMSVGAALSDDDAGLVTGAVAVLGWHDRARYSALDGSETEPSLSGWSRISATSGHEEFPRTDPAVICLVHDGADRVLLARQPTWPQRRFSVLAGFVEAGESLEACVAREIAEEVGVTVHDIRYLGSQPWPFPRSVMIAFAAVGDPSQPLRFQDGEIAEAAWFTRDEVRRALGSGDWASSADAPLLLPGSISIARVMLESWASESVAD
ncbi:NAD(+) diphosphatase [Rhodococcus rhodnii]|uniref:NAD(+) diphosphatase n=1 Tax=Rhodococcus rhodnii TaxID=38312 RepID=A0A6P2CIY6_9NOCA|nr:NAD(+) diphosphatase [Rhodococcus rhodnii]TXG92605.1 NAD(+) diphosphatase [Rhodococcus rhodnii]